MSKLNKFWMKQIGFNIVLMLYMFTGLPAYAQKTVSPVKIIGVTDGSVYTDFVKPKWYVEEPVTATIQRNSGRLVSFANGQKIAENGNYQLVVTKSVDGVITETKLDFVVNSSAGSALILTNTLKEGTELRISYRKGSYNRNDRAPVMALWVEDLAGNFIQNLYVSAMVGTNITRYGNNIKKRPQALPYWMHKSSIEKNYGRLGRLLLADPAVPLPGDLDAVTGATQLNSLAIKTKAMSTNEAGTHVKIFFELNQPFDWGWYFNLNNASHEEEGAGLLLDDIFFSGGSPGEPAIVYMVEVDLGKAQTYVLSSADATNEVLPIGYSHYAGRTGTLYTDFYYPDGNGVEKYKFDHAHRMLGSLTIKIIPSR